MCTIYWLCNEPNANKTPSDSFIFKTKITGSTPVDGNVKDLKVALHRWKGQKKVRALGGLKKFLPQIETVKGLLCFLPKKDLKQSMALRCQFQMLILACLSINV